MSDDLVKRLREDQPVTQDMVSTMQCALQDAAADRIEELEAKLASAEAMLEREIRRVQKIQRDLPPPHKVDLVYVEAEYRLMLAELKRDK